MIKLAIQNLKEQKVPVILGVISIIIAGAGVMILWGLHNGISQSAISEAKKSSPENQLIVRQQPDRNKITSLIPGLSQKKLDKMDLDKIENLSNIEEIHPESFFSGIASIEVNALGLNLITDSMLFGLPHTFIKENNKISNSEWSSTSPPYPAIIPGRILDLYNLTLAPAQGLPTLTEKDLIGKHLTLYPNYSSFFPNLREKRDSIPLKIVGFSDRTNLAGITLSPEIIKVLNEKYFGKSEDQYLEFYLRIKDSPGKTAAQIESLGYATSYLSKNIEEIQQKLAYLKYTLSVLAIIIIILSVLSIAASFLARFHDKSKEIALYYALGSTTTDARKILLYESIIIGVTGSFIGGIVAIIISHFLNIFLKTQLQIDITTVQIIRISPGIFLSTIILSTTIVIIAGLLPMHKASKASPASLLN